MGIKWLINSEDRGNDYLLEMVDFSPTVSLWAMGIKWLINPEDRGNDNILGMVDFLAHSLPLRHGN